MFKAFPEASPSSKHTSFANIRSTTKTEPPAVLAPHFKDDEFQKSQAYGKDKAKFSIFSGLFGQFLGSAMIHYGFYA